MKTTAITALILTVCTLLGCNKEKLFDGPNNYTDDFESYTELSDLFSSEQRWSFNQQTKTGNAIQVDSNFAHSGSKSIKCYALASDDQSASKSSLIKQFMAFWEGETVRMKASYYIEGTEQLNWLFLMDLEEKVAIGAGPGMRIALEEEQLVVEYKFNEKSIYQDEENGLTFPRNQWVDITWELHLSRDKKGWVKVWQDDQLVIDQQGVNTLPKDILYVQQGTKGMYSNAEIGITANSRDHPATVWVDDFEIKRIE